jgi:AraC-like DNA-binding protein
MSEAYPKAYLYRRIVQVKLYIDAHYADPIDGEAISGEATFSKFHFIRLFKRHVGVPPSTFRSAALRKKEEMRSKPLTFVPGCFASAKGWM